MENGGLAGEIGPVESTLEDGSKAMHEVDEGIRFETTIEKLAGLQPAFKPDGIVTAGNSSQISDGAAALLIMDEDTAKKMNLEPMARFKAFSLAGVDPVMMLTGPIPATSKALDRAGMSIDEIDLFEVNEAFASVTAAWRIEHGGSDPMALWERTNVNGGAIALGHPLGMSGAAASASRRCVRVAAWPTAPSSSGSEPQSDFSRTARRPNGFGVEVHHGISYAPMLGGTAKVAPVKSAAMIPETTAPAPTAGLPGWSR